jgi:hypothetical protein
MKRFLISIVLISALFSVTAAAQSAKFAASWDINPVSATSWDECDPADIPPCTDNPDGVNVDVEMARLKVPEGKEIFIGVSSEILIHLITEAKGGRKNDGGTTTNFSSTAMASGSVDVTLSLVSDAGDVCGIAPSNSVTLKSEMRELTVSGGGDMTMLEDEEFWIEVGITTDSKGAHHFEFLGVDCTQGMYTLTATFDLLALTEASGYDSYALATVTLYDRMITMQQVRAVKGSIVDPDA